MNRKYFFDDKFGDIFFLVLEDDSSYGGDPTRGKIVELVLFRRLTLKFGVSLSA